MRTFAEINSENIVINIIVAASAEWCQENLGGNWIECFQDESQRYNYPAKGWDYDPENDAFIPPQEFSSWILNTETFKWEPPIPRPQDENVYHWDEESQSWQMVVE